MSEQPGSPPGHARPADEESRRWVTRARSFGSAAQCYDLGRPSYPPAAVRWAIGGNANGDGYDGPAPHRVLDLAAGTGKLTRPLLGLGVEVVAVEPAAAMRALIPREATVLDGSAEQIPLDDHAVDAVVVGQAWHWFDPVPSAAEIVRVLRPGGFAAGLWNISDDSHELTARYAALVGAGTIADHRPESGPPWPVDSGIVDPQHATFPSTTTFDADRLVAYAASLSGVIIAEPDQRKELLRAVRELAPPGSFEMHEVCVVWRGHT